ncbi:MAG: hypothetical protein ACXWOH_03945 [Bdellovibrionota bacterium]
MSFIGNMLGNRTGITEIQSCTTTSQESASYYDWGYLGHAQAVLCHLKIDLKLSAAGSATGNVITNGTATVMAIHAEVSAPSGGVTVGGVSYEAQAKVWGCNKQNSACTSVSQFAPLAFLVWTKNSAGVNKGYAEVDYSLWHATSGQTYNGLYNQGATYLGIAVTWDLSTSLTKQTLTIKQTTTSGIGVHAEVQRTVSTGDLAIQLIGGSTSSAARINVLLNNSAKTGQVYSECTGGYCSSFTGSATTAGSAQNTTGDTPSANCFNYTWVEAVGGTASMANAAARSRTFTDGSAGTCALSAFPSDNLTGTSNMTWAATLPNLNAMSAPSSI